MLAPHLEKGGASPLRDISASVPGPRCLRCESEGSLIEGDGRLELGGDEEVIAEAVRDADRTTGERGDAYVGVGIEEQQAGRREHLLRRAQRERGAGAPREVGPRSLERASEPDAWRPAKLHRPTGTSRGTSATALPGRCTCVTVVLGPAARLCGGSRVGDRSRLQITLPRPAAALAAAPDTEGVSRRTLDRLVPQKRANR